MFSHLRASLLFIILLVVSLSAQHGFCQKETTRVTNYLVSFNPPVAIAEEEDAPDCIGIIRSTNHIALTSSCATAARHLRQTGAVTVLNYQENNIGQLPAIGDQPFAALQTLLEPERLVPFVRDLEPDSTFPIFSDIHDLESDDSAVAYYLLNPPDQTNIRESQPVQLQQLSLSKGIFSVSGMSSELLEQYPVGSPVVNDQNDVLCLLADGGLCESSEAKFLVGDDGSCQVPYFQCSNVTWDGCSQGSGAGQCHNTAGNEDCLVVVVPDNTDKGKAHCRRTGGCGLLVCPSDCQGEDCDCLATWGFSSLGQEAIEAPANCIVQHGGDGGVDSRCNNLNPHGFRHSKGFWPVVIGVPVAVVAVSAIAIIAGVIYKHRHKGYNEIKE